MSDMHGITIPQAVETLRKMTIDKENVKDMDDVYLNMSVEAAVRILPLQEKMMNFQWDVRGQLEAYKKQQSENEVLSENGKWLATVVIDQCLKILDKCILEASGLPVEGPLMPDDDEGEM